MSGLNTSPAIRQTEASRIMAAILKSSREKSEQEYEVILTAFLNLLDCWENGAEKWETIADIITLRAAFLIERAILGMSLDFEQALAILRNHNDFTTARDRQMRDTLEAAIDNLVEFAAAQEYSMVREIPDELDGSLFEEYEGICRRYNHTWAAQENEDAFYAAAMAGWWIGVSSGTVLTFMTQGDERVRPWHEALEGLSYSKSDFPAELIPPIEYGCRCYLVADGYGEVIGSLPTIRTTPEVHPVFRESLCTGGRIFSDEHPYFRQPLPSSLQKVVGDIKAKFYGSWK